MQAAKASDVVSQDEHKAQAPSHTMPPACPMLLDPMLLDGKGRGDSHRCCGNSSCHSINGSGHGSTVSLKCCPCREIEYCGKICQKQDWGSHQVNCAIAKAHENADWMAQMVREPGQKGPAMHGFKVVQSKCLPCKRTITVAPEVKYYNLVCRFM